LFKAGDHVRLKNDHRQADTVKSVPGMQEYDKCGFMSANEGFVLKKNRWERQAEWELYFIDPLKRVVEEEIQYLKGGR